jgi:restriction endonuclease Mrr
MTILRVSKARYDYTCTNCSRIIKKGSEYFRAEPHPQARSHRGQEVQYLCVICVHGEEYVQQREQEKKEWLKNYWTSSASTPTVVQQSLCGDEQVEVLQTKVHLANITAELIKLLSNDPEQIYQLSPKVFEELICDRLQEMNFGIARGGNHTFQKDGGVDIIAWPERSTFPFLMAVQVKHHRSPQYKTGPGDVRDLLGVIQSLPFNAGVLVTNTTFTPDAKWFANQRKSLLRLRDIGDIKRWLENNYLDEYDWREMPEFIEVCPGVVIQIPKSGLTKL